MFSPKRGHVCFSRCQQNKFLVNVNPSFIVKEVITHDSMPSYRQAVGWVRQSHRWPFKIKSDLYVIVTTVKPTKLGKERFVLIFVVIG